MASAALAAPPRVAQTVPENGATDVAPTLTEIRVTFDQDMGGGFSWCGGGPAFPKTPGQPRWVDARTCVLPVKLEPDHEYQMSINSRSFTNFKSRQGEAATAYPLSFKTGAGPAATAGKKYSVSDNVPAIAELRRAIDEAYSYRDLRKVDWNKLFEEHKQKMLQAMSPTEFAQEAAALLANAKDVHIWLKVGPATIGAYQREYTPNWNLKTLERTVPGWEQQSPLVTVGKFPDGMGYIMISSWDADRADALEPAFEALDDFVGAKGLVVDVRPNGGGSEPLAQQFAGCFLDKPVAYAKDVYRGTGQSGFTQPQDRVVKPKKGRPRYRGPVAVLMGPGNMSSCESFLLMMKQVPGCKLVGGKSYGSSGNPKPFDLGNGVTVFLPSWQDLRLDGSLLEGEGIAPDISVQTTEADLLTKDPVLDAALAYLRSGAGPGK
jgi:hypothetical protein